MTFLQAEQTLFYGTPLSDSWLVFPAHGLNNAACVKPLLGNLERLTRKLDGKGLDETQFVAASREQV